MARQLVIVPGFSFLKGVRVDTGIMDLVILSYVFGKAQGGPLRFEVGRLLMIVATHV